MTAIKAIVVEHDEETLHAVDEVLTVLGHGYDVAPTILEANRLLASANHNYILLGNQTLGRPGGTPSPQNSIIFLETAPRILGGPMPPVVVIADRLPGIDDEEKFGWAASMRARGATAFICKPFRTIGRTLDRVILDAIGTRCQQPPAAPKPPKEAISKPFSGGELVFFPDRVELCGVRVLGDTGLGVMRAILEQLTQKNKFTGNWIALSGEQLAKAVNAAGGQNSAAGCIRDLRNNVIRVLVEELNLIAGPQDVIQTSPQGYRLREWITVRFEENTWSNTWSSLPRGEADDQVNVSADQVNDQVSGPVDHVFDQVKCSAGGSDQVFDQVNAAVDQVSGTDDQVFVQVNDQVNGKADQVNPGEYVPDHVTPRRRRILAELQRGCGLRTPAIAAAIRCSTKTAHRELDTLRTLGMIEYVGSPKTGCYKLKT